MKYKKSKALALSWGVVFFVFAIGVFISALMHATVLAVCISSVSLVASAILGNVYRKQVEIENLSAIENKDNQP
jgi:hypothetical protein